jgi:hypothetical protein
MPKVSVSGVPYTVDMPLDFKTVDEACDYYEGLIFTLEQENKQMRARMKRLEEEVEWLENQSRRPYDPKPL